MKLGERITKIRKDHQLSQEAFAEQFNVTRQTVSNWENGKSFPDLETLVKISEIFDVSVDDLIKNKSSKEDSVTLEKKPLKKHVLLISTLLVLLGLLLFIFIGYGLLTKNVGVNYQMQDEQTFTVEKGQPTTQVAKGHFSLPKEGEVRLSVDANTDSGKAKVVIINTQTKEVVYQKESDGFKDRQKLNFPQGSYEIQITVNDYQESTVSVTYHIKVKGS